MVLAIQLTITVFLQVYLTSSEKVMGRHKSTPVGKNVLFMIDILISILNVMLLISFF